MPLFDLDSANDDIITTPVVIKVNNLMQFGIDTQAQIQVKQFCGTLLLKVCVSTKQQGQEYILYETWVRGKTVQEILETINHEWDNCLRLCELCERQLVTKAPEAMWADRIVCAACFPMTLFISPSIDKDCPICMEPLRGMLSKFPDCSHAVHTRCVVRKNIPCPLKCSPRLLVIGLGSMEIEIDADSESDE